MTVALHEAYVPDTYMPPQPETYGHGAMRLVEWAREATAAHELATALCETPFAGAYRGNPGAATAAILKGAEVGLTPVTSLGAFDLIQGQPAPKAITLRALVQSHGHEMVLVTSTDTKCVMKGRRRESTEWQTVEWTIDRARRLGLTGKDNWTKQPDTMLVARATSQLARLIGSDVILGIGYSAEELTDDEPEPMTRARRQRATVEVVPMPEPDLTSPTDSGTVDRPSHDETVPESPYLNTSSGLAKRMFAMLGDAGITEKQDRLEFVSETVDRLITTSTEMTDADAEAVIKRLDDMLSHPFGDEPEVTQ